MVNPTRPSYISGREFILHYELSNDSFAFLSCWLQVSCFFLKRGLISYAGTSDIQVSGKRSLVFYIKTKERISFSVEASGLSLASVQGSVLPGTYSLANKSKTPLHAILLAVINARNSGSLNYRVSPDLEILVSG